MLRIAEFIYSYIYAIDFLKNSMYSVNKTDVRVVVLIELFDVYMFRFLF